MKKTFKIATLAALASLTVPAANAATVSYNDTMSVTEGTSNTLNLTQFNTGLGTLTGVQITITLSVPSFSIVVDNDSAASANVTVSFSTFGGATFNSTASTYNGSNTLSGSDFNVTTQSSTFTVGAQALDSTTQFDNDGGGDNGSFTTSSVLVGQVSTRNIHSTAFGGWTGAGNVGLDLTIDFATDMNINSGGGGGATRFQGIIPSATYSAEVTYTYDLIPEPGAALLGSLGLLALLRRRR